MAESLRIGLATLDRGPIERTLTIEDAATELGDLPFPLDRVEVAFEIRREARDGARARGTLRARTEVECRRCLTPTPVDVETSWEALFRPPGAVTPGEEGIWALDPETNEVDLADPIREELWVSAPAYVECATDCPGLCPRCGATLAEEACTCPPPDPDPRWAALGELRG